MNSLMARRSASLKDLGSVPVRLGSQKQVAPGKNRLFYLVGHLTAVHDRTFGEDDRKITKKVQTPEPAARAVCLRPYKTSEISNRLAGLRANEQYYQMCG
jgi:hypothetical protein